MIESQEKQSSRLAVHIESLQGEIDGMQFSLAVGHLTDDQLAEIHSEILSDDQWYYDPITGLLNISWSAAVAEDLSNRLLLSWPVSAPAIIELASHSLAPEAYFVQDADVEIRKVALYNGTRLEENTNEYHLYQNKPNPFFDGTVITFVLPQDEHVRLLVHDVTGKLVFEHAAFYSSGKHEVQIKGDDLGSTGIYYYTLHSNNASFTRKMSFTNM